jgi:hypothetical protein
VAPLLTINQATKKWCKLRFQDEEAPAGAHAPVRRSAAGGLYLGVWNARRMSEDSGSERSRAREAGVFYPGVQSAYLLLTAPAGQTSIPSNACRSSNFIESGSTLRNEVNGRADKDSPERDHKDHNPTYRTS